MLWYISEIELIHSFNCGGRVCKLFYFLCRNKDIKSNCIRLDLYFCLYIVKKKTRIGDCYLQTLCIGANCFWTLISLFEQYEFI